MNGDTAACFYCGRTASVVSELARVLDIEEDAICCQIGALPKICDEDEEELLASEAGGD